MHMYMRQGAAVRSVKRRPIYPFTGQLRLKTGCCRVSAAAKPWQLTNFHEQCRAQEHQVGGHEGCCGVALRRKVLCCCVWLQKEEHGGNCCRGGEGARHGVGTGFTSGGQLSRAWVRE